MKLPSEPRDLKAHLSDDGYIHVYWNAPSQNTFAVQKYTVYWSTATLPEKYDDVDSDLLSYTIKGIHSYSLYTIYVKAGNHYGYSKESNQAFVTVGSEFKQFSKNYFWTWINILLKLKKLIPLHDSEKSESLF